MYAKIAVINRRPPGYQKLLKVKSLLSKRLLSLQGGLPLLCLSACLAAPAANAQTNTATGIDALRSNTTGIHNTANGYHSLTGNTIGECNSALGSYSLVANTSGGNNTAAGYASLFQNISGGGNTAVGYFSMYANQTGGVNTAVGFNSLYSNQGFGQTAVGAGALQSHTGANTGEDGLAANTAVGFHAMMNNSEGLLNTAVGTFALEGSNDSTGSANTAIGYQALTRVTSGENNTANGRSAMSGNRDGKENVAIGSYALQNNSSGNENTAMGVSALERTGTSYYQTAIGWSSQHFNTGSSNTSIGHKSLFGTYEAENTGEADGSYNTALGTSALEFATKGDNNIAVGYQAGRNVTDGSNNIHIGNVGATESNTIRIGTSGTHVSAYIAGIDATVIAGGTTVHVDGTGKLGKAPSSQRYKQDVRDMGEISDAIHSLRPVTFRYKSEFDSAGIPQFGLIAEEVASISPDLVVYNAEGQVDGVRYDAVNAMLLNEFQEQRAVIQQQQVLLLEQQKEIAALRSQFEAWKASSNQ
jgi:Chaperone of endosialidase